MRVAYLQYSILPHPWYFPSISFIYKKIHHPCGTLVPNYYFDYQPPGSKEAKSEVQGLVDFFAVIVQNAIAIFILQMDLPWVQRSGMRDYELNVPVYVLL